MEEEFETHRVFLLSPATVAGKRAKMLLNPEARFDLARRLHADGGLPLGEAFAFMSGLYFRGKLAYARAFAQPPHGTPGVLIITSSRGLVSADAVVSAGELRAYGNVPIDAKDERYSRPLIRDATSLAARCSKGCSFILLGSVASGRYLDHLLPIFGQRLYFPQEFVGRGDMSRGALLLRGVAADRLLIHVRVTGVPLRGRRPPKLAARRSVPSSVPYRNS